jgi:nickel/cobalt exporter
MHATSIPLLLIAAGTVGFLHSILPDHWVPLAVVARTQRWSLIRTARTSLLASVGHVLTSVVLGGVIAIIGLQFRKTFETQQGHIVGVVLVITGIGFLIWGLSGHEHHHHHEHGDETQGHDDVLSSHPAGHPHEESHRHIHGHEHRQHHEHGAGELDERSGARRATSILIPFGAAASPDLTILPVFLAASAIGLGTVIGVLTTFSVVTLTTFVVLTVGATLAGYQVKGEWLEDHGNTITAVVLIGIGIAVYVGL